MRLCCVSGAAWALSFAALLLNAALAAERHYYIAAVHIDWNYGSSEQRGPGTSYKKVVYREYDAAFDQQKTHPSWLGLLGPTLRGQEGDVIVVTFKNMADQPCNIHTHGIAYGKQSEGALYFDNTSQKEKEDDVVMPGESHTYFWEVTEDVAPRNTDPPCITYTYLSHSDMVRDYNTGLIGTMLICRKGSLDGGGQQIHFHQEAVLLFGVFDESKSWYSGAEPTAARNVRYTINGYANGSVPDLRVCAHSSVSWHLLGMSSEPELFSVHFNGQVLRQNDHSVSSIGVVSGSATSATMTAIFTGRWLVSSHISKHLQAGMHAFFTVEMCDRFKTPQRQLTIKQMLESQEWTYYIAAEEMVWDYAPNMPDYIDGDFRSKYLKQGPDRIGKKYKKAVYTLYTDSTFTKRAESKQRKNELGIIGPVIRAQIRDKIKVVFKNKATHPYSIYPHGLTINKDNEGANYPPGGNQTHAVQPGETYIYIWTVAEEDEPLASDARCLTRMYHSAVNTPRDIASGLIGPLLICKGQSLNKKNVQLKADKEQHAMFATFDENKSWYLDDNIKESCGDPPRVRKEDAEFYKSNVMHTINGFVYESGQVLGFCNGEIVTWHVSSIGNQDGIQTVTFYGHTFELNKREEDFLNLFPMTGEAISMYMDNAGDWLLSSLNSHETTKGMRLRFKDVECFRDYVYEYTDEDEFEVLKPVDPGPPKVHEMPKVIEYKEPEAIDELTDYWANVLNLRSYNQSRSSLEEMELLDLSMFDSASENSPGKTQSLPTSANTGNGTSVPASTNQTFEDMLRGDFNFTARENLTKNAISDHIGPQPTNKTYLEATRDGKNIRMKGKLNDSLSVNETETGFMVLSTISLVNDTEYSNLTESESSIHDNVPSKPGNVSTRTVTEPTPVSSKISEEDPRDDGISTMNITKGNTFLYSVDPNAEDDIVLLEVEEITEKNRHEYTVESVLAGDTPESHNHTSTPTQNVNQSMTQNTSAGRENVTEIPDGKQMVNSSSSNSSKTEMRDHMPTTETPSVPGTANEEDSTFILDSRGLLEVLLALLKFGPTQDQHSELWNTPRIKTTEDTALNQTEHDNMTFSNQFPLNQSASEILSPSNNTVQIPNIQYQNRSTNSSTSPAEIYRVLSNASEIPQNTSVVTSLGSFTNASWINMTNQTLIQDKNANTSQESESIEEVVIYLRENGSEVLMTTALDLQEEYWGYDKEHESIPMEIPDHMIKYFEDKPQKKEPKKRIVHRRTTPVKGHAMKTKKRKEYKAQAKDALSPRGPKPGVLLPRGARPISSEEDLLSRDIIIGVPRQDFNDYDLYTTNNAHDTDKILKKNAGTSQEEYEFVDYKDPYSSQLDIQHMTLDETTKYFVKMAGTNVRHYFITAEEVEWDYAGYGQRRSDKTESEELPTKFTKVVFRGYMDHTFTTPIIRGEVDEHLGILGPVIKAEEDQTIMVFFKNLASRPYSLHANGVSYTKQMEGLSYDDGSPYWYHYDNEVKPNGSYTYLWKVNSKVGPQSSDSDCRTWAYYSGVNPERDINSGLIGPLLVCRKGALSEKKMNAREFSLLFMTFDENKSWYYVKNRDRLERRSRKVVMDPMFKENIKFPAINGIIYSLKGLRMYTNQQVTWHLMNMGSPKDIHSVHFHGQTFLNHHIRNHRQGVYPLLPGEFATLEMWPSKPGLWLLESEVGMSQQKGMQTLFLVIDVDCSHPLGLESGSVLDSHITASGHRGQWEPHLARLQNTGKYNAWSTDRMDDWIQVDFHRPVVISKVATQGAKEMFKSNYVINYTISYSTDRRKWFFYKGNSEAYRMTFEGNSNGYEVKENLFFPPLIGRFVRLHPFHYYNAPTVRMEFYGCELDGCSLPLGMKSGLIEDKHITASSTASSWYGGTWEPSLARLDRQGAVNAWQAKHNDMKQWLQIELSVVKKVTGIVTQGAKALGKQMFVSAFVLEYSEDGRRWKKYTDDLDYDEKVFTGNTDNRDHMRNYIYPPIFSRFIRIIPRTWQRSITMRVELLGCDF
ncbi:coagulation factor V isoform X2 [Denticeps clupeoides]|uniref:ferroxidase n=1 Tax=Denticeps clupeoides TaxID=299321 RepID=A0AAY4AT97_9TELE|nr:coagulation factor V-like isoform X2 [Denticeps clupeoides]